MISADPSAFPVTCEGDGAVGSWEGAVGPKSPPGRATGRALQEALKAPASLAAVGPLRRPWRRHTLWPRAARCWGHGTLHAGLFQTHFCFGGRPAGWLGVGCENSAAVKLEVQASAETGKQVSPWWEAPPVGPQRPHLCLLCIAGRCLPGSKGIWFLFQHSSVVARDTCVGHSSPLDAAPGAGRGEGSTRGRSQLSGGCSFNTPAGPPGSAATGGSCPLSKGTDTSAFVLGRLVFRPRRRDCWVWT